MSPWGTLARRSWTRRLWSRRRARREPASAWCHEHPRPRRRIAGNTPGDTGTSSTRRWGSSSAAAAAGDSSPGAGADAFERSEVADAGFEPAPLSAATSAATSAAILALFGSLLGECVSVVSSATVAAAILLATASAAASASAFISSSSAQSSWLGTKSQPAIFDALLCLCLDRTTGAGDVRRCAVPCASRSSMYASAMHRTSGSERAPMSPVSFAKRRTAAMESASGS
mmetsp:Transcript_7200/g.28332  ORF Transcript_7200/g.28332 Transcript_7200/m.28332 type:complete len:229 (+) Transcript_7200:678-1364(+)